jgi:hypothetical protein
MSLAGDDGKGKSALCGGRRKLMAVEQIDLPSSDPILGRPASTPKRSANPAGPPNAASEAAEEPAISVARIEKPAIFVARIEKPRRKAGCQRGIPRLRPHAEVNSRSPKMSELLGFSGPIIGQRECRPKASWRREAHSPLTFFSLDFDCARYRAPSVKLTMSSSIFTSASRASISFLAANA